MGQICRCAFVPILLRFWKHAFARIHISWSLLEVKGLEDSSIEINTYDEIAIVSKSIGVPKKAEEKDKNRNHRDDNYDS